MKYLLFNIKHKYEEREKNIQEEDKTELQMSHIWESSNIKRPCFLFPNQRCNNRQIWFDSKTKKLPQRHRRRLIGNGNEFVGDINCQEHTWILDSVMLLFISTRIAESLPSNNTDIHRVMERWWRCGKMQRNKNYPAQSTYHGRKLNLLDFATNFCN